MVFVLQNTHNVRKNILKKNDFRTWPLTLHLVTLTLIIMRSDSMWQELTIIKVSCTDKFLLISLVNYSSLHVQFYSRHKTPIWYDPPNWNANHLPQPHKSSPTPSQIISHILTDHFPHSFRSSPIPSHIIFHFLTNHLPQPTKNKTAEGIYKQKYVWTVSWCSELFLSTMAVSDLMVLLNQTEEADHLVIYL